MNWQANSDFNRRLACRGCLAAGLGLLALTLVFAVNTSLFLHNSVSTTGTIVSLRTVSQKTYISDNAVITITYAPVFTFTASNGQTYTVSSDTGSNPPEFQPGRQVKVIYEARHPSGARIASFLQLWLFPLVFGFIGATSTALGYALYRYQKQCNPEFRLIPSLPPAKPDLKEYLLCGPKVDDFTVERDPDTGRPVTL